MLKNTKNVVECKIDVHLVNSFTQNKTGGNPAGVVLTPPSLSSEQKINIAKKVGFSETAFVTAGKEADFNVEFYTPEGEVDFCGHATLAVFSCMASLGLITPGNYTQKTKAGILNVAVEHNRVVMDQALPLTHKGPSVKDVSAALGVQNEAISNTGLPIEVVSTGLPDIIVPVQAGQLDTLKPNYETITKLSRDYGTIGFHVFELSSDTSTTAHCRNFAPLYGINEESATGSASGALGCYLANHVMPGETFFLLEQGRAMGCPSFIQVTIDSEAGTIHRVRVGGQATMTGTKTISLKNIL